MASYVKEEITVILKYEIAAGNTCPQQVFNTFI